MNFTDEQDRNKENYKFKKDMFLEKIPVTQFSDLPLHIKLYQHIQTYVK